MGNSSAPQPIPPPLNPVMNSIYNTSGRIPYASNHRSFVPPSKTKETSKLKLDSYIDKNTLQLTELSPLWFNLSFSFTSEVPCTINLYFFSKEVTNEYQQSLMISDDRYGLISSSANFAAGSKQMFSFPINLQHLSIQEIFVGNLVPITIEIFPYYYNSGQGAMLRSLCKFERKGARIEIAIKKQVAIYGGMYYVLMEMFGISGDGENLCVICLCEARDTMISPCRHACLCKYCSQQLGVGFNKKCPVCRNDIREFITLKMD